MKALIEKRKVQRSVYPSASKLYIEWYFVGIRIIQIQA